jgi:uncharacterized coiled-coil protein SlyX
MSETKKEMEVMDIIKNALPGIDFEATKELPEQKIDDLQARVNAMEKTIKSLTDTLAVTVQLYEKTKVESKELTAAHQGFVGAAKKANNGLVDSLVGLLDINYTKLVKSLEESKYLDKDKVMLFAEDHIKSLMDEPLFLSRMGEAIRKSILNNIEEHLDGVDGDSIQDSLMENIDFGHIAEHVEICYDTLYEYVSFDPTDYWDASDIAYNFEASDITEYVEVSYVAEHIDVDDVANSLDAETIAGHVEVDYDVIAEHLNMDDLAEMLAGDETLIAQLKDHVQITLNKED